jgi:enoyl-CoA hydratase
MRAAHESMIVRQRIVDDGRALLAGLLDLRQPIIAALHGDAIGLGATVVLACDAVVASRTVRIADPHVCIGLVAGDGGCVMWPSSLGMMRAKRHLLTGDPLTAEDAYAFGIVTDLVDAPDDVRPAARALAARIATLPPLAVQGTKRALNRILQERSGEVTDLAFALETVTFGSDDLIEAIAAFKAHRDGRYEGT